MFYQIIFFIRAAAYIKINDLQNALEDCQKAVSLNPNYSRAYGRMGYDSYCINLLSILIRVTCIRSVYKMMNKSGEAREAFKKVSCV